MNAITSEVSNLNVSTRLDISLPTKIKIPLVQDQQSNKRIGNPKSNLNKTLLTIVETLI